MVQAYARGLNQPDKAVHAQEIITEARPTAGDLRHSSPIYAYQAGQTRKGDLARDKALELADPDKQQGAQGPARPGQAAGARQQVQQATPTPTPATPAAAESRPLHSASPAPL